MVSPSSPAASFVVRHRVHLGVLGALFLVGAFLVWRFVQRWDLFLESKVRPWADAVSADKRTAAHRTTVNRRFRVVKLAIAVAFLIGS